ncbi:MAG: hypothetical protein CO187_10910 [Zetaproteobacteria bacterium CG_4_9_14_3_um_filter_53_7]|nr:MAG: hypothetical protein CO187_10910 [Zetaproteobacteria bacterium CG_4_9_14_3_um_filter_53_7]
MKLTFALGVQFDNGQSGAFSFMSKDKGSPDSVAQSEPLIDVAIGTQAAMLPEVSSNYSAFFLTYDVHGQPDPVLNDAVSVDLFA